MHLLCQCVSNLFIQDSVPTSLDLVHGLSFAVNQGLLLLYVQKVLVMFSEKLMYVVSVSESVADPKTLKAGP